MQTQTFPHTLNKDIPTGVFRDTEGRCPCIQADGPKHLGHTAIYHVLKHPNTVLFYILSCDSEWILQVCPSGVKVPFSIVFLMGCPPLIWSSLPGHFCHPLLWPHPETALSWDRRHSPAFSYCLHSLSTQSTSRLWTGCSLSTCKGTFWSHFLPNSC